MRWNKRRNDKAKGNKKQKIKEYTNSYLLKKKKKREDECLRIYTNSHFIAYDWRYLNGFWLFIVIVAGCMSCDLLATQHHHRRRSTVFCVFAVSFTAKPGMSLYNKLAPFCHVFTAIRTINNSKTAIKRFIIHTNILEKIFKCMRIFCYFD